MQALLLPPPSHLAAACFQTKRGPHTPHMLLLLLL
jgi:hypothetical protein